MVAVKGVCECPGWVTEGQTTLLFGDEHKRFCSTSHTKIPHRHPWLQWLLFHSAHLNGVPACAQQRGPESSREHPFSCAWKEMGESLFHLKSRCYQFIHDTIILFSNTSMHLKSNRDSFHGNHASVPRETDRTDGGHRGPVQLHIHTHYSRILVTIQIHKSIQLISIGFLGIPIISPSSGRSG